MKWLSSFYIQQARVKRNIFNVPLSLKEKKMPISVVSINIEIQLVVSRQVISFLRLTLAIVHLYDVCNLQYIFNCDYSLDEWD